MLKIKEKLEESREKYELAVKTIENLQSFISSQKTVLKQSLQRKELVEDKVQILRILDLHGNNLDKPLNMAKDILSYEIDIISSWTNGVKVAINNFKNYPVESLQIQFIRAEFENGLDALKDVNELFLSQPQKIFVEQEVVESLQEAEGNIEILMREMDSLQSVVTELQDGTSYLESYNQRKRDVRQTRQELKELARRTLTKERELKFLLEDLLQNNNSFLFESYAYRMNKLMLKIKEKLEESREKYELAVKTIENLQSFLSSQKIVLKQILQRKELVEYKVRILRILDLHGNNLDKPLNMAKYILSYEIDIISSWTNGVKVAIKNFQDYPVEVLQIIQPIREHFENKLDALKNVNELFLSTPQKIFVEQEVDSLSAYKQLRRELVQLADRTVNEVRDLKIVLDDLDWMKTGNENVLYRIHMTRMKDLMIETLWRLSEAGKSANEALNDGTNEDYMSEEINLIRNWTKGAEAVKGDFDLLRLQREFRQKQRTIRAIFKNGLVDLKNYAEQFIV